MANPKNVYTNPKPDQPLLSTISSNCKTPILQVKFSTLVKPFYYANSPKIARYSVTCLVSPAAHQDFLNGLQFIEKNEGVDTIIKNDTIKNEEGDHVTTGSLLIKFQTKNMVPIYRVEGPAEPELIELEDELAPGEKIAVTYDILRYTKKNTMKTEHGLSFKLVHIHYFPND
jgi:hypothetical protein